MAGDAEQTDSSGKYTFGGGAAAAKKYWPTIFKAIELILCGLCIVLVDDPAQNIRTKAFLTQRTVSLCYVTFGTFLIYSIVFLVGKLIRDEWPWKTTAILAAFAAFLFLLCGFFLLKDYSDTKERNIWPPNTTRLDLVCASGVMSVITFITYTIDAILMITAGNRGEFEY